MASWQLILLITVGTVVIGLGAGGWWIRRSPLTAGQTAAKLHAHGLDLVRLPGRLRRVAADPRTPRRARWLLVALAVYVASPIDLIPDVIPVIGHLDELVIVPLVLIRVKRMVPPEVWADHFPSSSASPTSAPPEPQSKDAHGQ